jgi:hypothetical protein
MLPPSELEKPPATTDGSNASAPDRGISALKVYRCDARDASPSLGDRVLQRVCREVREQPQRLPLAAHRLGGLVNVGRLPYRQTWDALYDAATGAGAGDGWVLRCLYAGFAESNVSELPSPTLWALVTGGVE